LFTTNHTKYCETIVSMFDTIADSTNAPVVGKSAASDCMKSPSARQGKYNKSIDFDRHKITSPRKGNKGNIKNKENIDSFGDSYATLSESFMGESFANLSMSVLALDILGGDDDSEFEDEYDNQLERVISHQITQKSKLDSIVDFEDDEEDIKSRD
jgi:hypothetical protein